MNEEINRIKARLWDEEQARLVKERERELAINHRLQILGIVIAILFWIWMVWSFPGFISSLGN